MGRQGAGELPPLQGEADLPDLPHPRLTGPSSTRPIPPSCGAPPTRAGTTPAGSATTRRPSPSSIRTRTSRPARGAPSATRSSPTRASGSTSSQLDFKGDLNMLLPPLPRRHPASGRRRPHRRPRGRSGSRTSPGLPAGQAGAADLRHLPQPARLGRQSRPAAWRSGSRSARSATYGSLTRSTKGGGGSASPLFLCPPRGRAGARGRGGKGRGGKGRSGEGKGREGQGREGQGREGQGRGGQGRGGQGRAGRGGEGRGGRAGASARKETPRGRSPGGVWDGSMRGGLSALAPSRWRRPGRPPPSSPRG